MTNKQIIVLKILHRKFKSEHREPNWKPGEIRCSGNKSSLCPLVSGTRLVTYVENLDIIEEGAKRTHMSNHKLLNTGETLTGFGQTKISKYQQQKMVNTSQPQTIIRHILFSVYFCTKCFCFHIKSYHTLPGKDSSNNKTLNARLLPRVITGCHYT